MNEEIKAKVKEHALKEFPNECCGFVCVNYLGEITVIPCENTAHNKKGRFVIDPKMNLIAEKTGHIAAFYHSHASEFMDENNDKFSKEDLDIAYETCIPALLYVIPQDTWHVHIPSTYQPSDLIGRSFVWGVWDCYSLVRDYHLLHKKTILGYHFPPDGANLKSNFGYETLIYKENFNEVALEDLRRGDVIIFQINSDYYNHSAIYLGGNEFLHQPIGKISSVAFLDDRYLKYIKKTLRHND